MFFNTRNLSVKAIAVLALSTEIVSAVSTQYQYGSAPAKNYCTPKGKGGNAAKTGKAIYFITNEAENAVVALPIGADGQVSQGSVTSTCGAGSNTVDKDKKPQAPDALASQASLVVAGKFIFAVNAGSNTVTMLKIDDADPTKLSLVGQPASLDGEFPNTVAASIKKKVMCAGMSGAKAGIICAPFDESAGIGERDAIRQLDLGQTTPPSGPEGTLSQVFFSDDEKSLLATIKGDPAVNNTGFFAAYAVDDAQEGAAKVSSDIVKSSPEGTAVLFGSRPIPGSSNVFITDASFGGGILAVDGSLTSTLTARVPVDGQKATCWTAISAASKSAFVTDVGVNRIIEMSLDDASILSTVEIPSDDPGLTDIVASGNFVYALSAGNDTVSAAVSVLDVSGGKGTAKFIQNFKLDGMPGVGKNSQGMQTLA